MIEQNIVTYGNPQQQQVSIYTPGHQALSMQQLALEWLQTKFNKSKSDKTFKAYRETLVSLDMYLQSEGLQLDSDPRRVALAIQQWAEISKSGKTVTSSTRNQRFAIASSFYQFAVKYGACQSNPVDYCERPKRIIEDAAPALEAGYVEEKIAAIDTTTREGKRDKTLLMLALVTGRRLSELTGLQWQHITLIGNVARVKWVRCKGGKVLEDMLSPGMTDLLMAFLKSEYGPKLETIKPGSYVFQSHSNSNQHGRLSADCLSKICLDRLGISKFHTTRHTFAVNSEAAGAPLSAIGDQLGHSNYNVTAEYLKTHKQNVYKYAGTLEKMFGLK